MKPTGNIFLFSIDLEDVRDFIPNGGQYKEAVLNNTLKYLDWLDTVQSKCTFFIVGKTARKYPDLIQEIIKRGHEPACHTDTHLHLTKHTPDTFRRDCDSFLDTMAKLGAPTIKGFRAPTFSMVAQSKWAYSILKEFNFTYSSSVLPSKHPIFGWADFKGEGYYDGIYELPMNLGSFPFNVPYGGGVYFRVLPTFILKSLFNSQFKNRRAVLSYMHPYDIDTQQERFMHPHLNDNALYNRLMYVNRSKVFTRLESVMKATNARILRYDQYLTALH